MTMQDGLTDRLSVAMCTFNGARFLRQQLDSLSMQTKPPDELIVCDDASQDATLKILQEFAHSAPFAVHLHRNPVRLGINANFEQAIQLCSGEIIALCDQDDVWLPNKLQILTEAFIPATDWVFCDAHVCDSQLNSIGYSLWNLVQFGTRERAQARDGQLTDILLKRHRVAGATLAFRSRYRSLLLPLPTLWQYDAWFALILSAVGQATFVETQLQCYRQHFGNAIGGRKRNLLEDARRALVLSRKAYYTDELLRWDALSVRIAQCDSPASAVHKVGQKIAHVRRRANFPDKRLLRLFPIIQELLHCGYSRYARNFGSVIIDLLLK